MRIETHRLVIRSIEEADAEALAALWTDPNVTRYMGGPRSYDAVLESLREDAQLNPQPALDLWPVIEKGTGQIVGHCGIIEKDVEGKSEYEIVYVLAKSAWGKGLATEAANSIKNYAFNQLGLKRLIALIDPDNPKSQSTASKIGLKHERDTVRPDGKSMRVFALTVADGQ